jgi:hypothetical protein
MNQIFYVPPEEEVKWSKVREMRWSGDNAISQSISMETFSARSSELQYENAEIFHFDGLAYY